jgi:hypothetical protein
VSDARDAREAAQGQEIALAEMIETLRRELEIAQMQGAARPVAFGVEKVELELKVVVSRKAKGEGGIKFWVVTAGAEAEGGSETVHNFKLTLSPLDAESKKRLEVGSNIDQPLDRNK